jgi:hypothetical protein
VRLTTVAVVASVLITACGPTLDIPKTQRLDRELPQYIAFDRPADQVWEALRAEAAARATCGVRGESRPDRVISRCERVRKWRDLGQDAVVARDGGKGDPDLAQKDDPKAVAITTAWVEQSTTGARLNVRRAYYSGKSFAGVAHSRGDFERELADRIAGRLTSGATPASRP